MSRLVNKNVSFLSLRIIFACCLVLYLYEFAVENSEIPGFSVSKIRALRTGEVLNITWSAFFCLRYKAQYFSFVELFKWT